MKATSYTCVTYNVSSVPDLIMRLHKYAGSIKKPQLKEIFNRDVERVSTEEYEAFQKAARSLYCALISTTFEKVITQNNGKKVDFICLQEFNMRNPDQERIVQILKKLGYHLIESNDLAIAFQADKFNFLYSQKLKSEALYIDVQDRNLSLKIRLVTDHLVGFNAKSQKEATAMLKSLHGLEQKKIAQFKEIKKLGPLQGDASIIENIQGVIPREPEGFIEKMMERMRNSSPNLMIYALDANSTNSHVAKEHRLHPKRLSVFTKQGFVCDEKDTDPTIIDIQDNILRKYDYIYAKAREMRMSISSAAVSAPLDHPEICMSDHLPVIATIALDA